MWYFLINYLYFLKIFTKLILNKSTSYKSLLCCGVIIFGFFIGCCDKYIDDKNNISFDYFETFQGIIFGVISSLCNSLYSVFVKKQMEKYNFITLQFYTNALGTIFMIPIFILNGELLKTIDYGITPWLNSMIWFLIFLTGIFGLLIGFASIFQIHVTSPLTHNISATAKAYFQTIMAVLIFQEFHHSLFFWLSNIIVVIGTIMYAIVRNQEMSKL